MPIEDIFDGEGGESVLNKLNAAIAIVNNIVPAGAVVVAVPFAFSDETTALTVDTGKITFRMPFAITVTEVRASLTVAGTTSGVTTFDINQGGTSILSTKLTIDYGDTTSVGADTPAVISTSALTDNAEITVDVDVITGGATEAGGKIYLIGTLV
jgi:hypothetical protein